MFGFFFDTIRQKDAEFEGRGGGQSEARSSYESEPEVSSQSHDRSHSRSSSETASHSSEDRPSSYISSSDYFSRKKGKKAKAQQSAPQRQERRLPLDDGYQNEIVEYRGVPIINRGDGDISKAKRVIDRVVSQPGYGEDFGRHIKSVTIQHRLKHDDGSHVCGWNHVGHVGISTRDSDGEVESHLKHELGHATHGSPEWAAEKYERNHF